MDKFQGFEIPKENYSKLPHQFVDLLPEIDSMAELKIVIYLLRHTWGYSEYDAPKKITTDEFCNGRKRRDGSRIDRGTGMTKQSVINGLDKAEEHGFILVETDDTDKARIQKSYSLNMAAIADAQQPETPMSKIHTSESKILGADVYNLDIVQRKKLKKEKLNIPLSVENQIFAGAEHVVSDDVALLKQAVTDSFGINVRWGSRAASKNSMSPADFEAWMFIEKVTVEQVQRAGKVWTQMKKYGWRTPTLYLIWENWNLLQKEKLPDEDKQTPWGAGYKYEPVGGTRD